MQTIIIIDLYNSKKEWVIKKYTESNYYWNQAIDGKLFYKFTRTTKKNIKEVLGVDI